MKAVTCLDFGVHRSTEQKVARIGEETNGRYALGVTGPCMDACLGDEGLLGASLCGKVWGVRKGGMHVGPALVIGHGLAVEHGGLLADAATLGFCFLLDDMGLWFVVLFGLVGGLLLFDTVQEGGLLLALPSCPWADVRAFAVDDVEVALVPSFAFEGLFLGVGGFYCVYGCETIFVGGVEGAKDGGSVGVDGGIDGVAEDGVCEMLCLECMVGHRLLLNVSGEGVLVEEAVPITERIFGALEGEGHVMIGNVDVDLCVGWTGDEGGVVEGVLHGCVCVRRARGGEGREILDGGHAARDLWRSGAARWSVISLLRVCWR